MKRIIFAFIRDTNIDAEVERIKEHQEKMSKLTQNKTQLKDIFTGPVMKPLFVSRPGSDVIPENDRRQRNYISHRQHCQFNIR